jgi:FixJ family two-component response regulator
MFRVAGFCLKVFGTAEEFLAQDRIAAASCLVLDVQLPGRSGLDLQAELKERDWPLPIVFISGHGTVAVAVEAMRAGAVHFLPKPFDNRQLLELVRQAIESQVLELAEVKEDRRISQLVNSLTAREHEVFLLVAAGLPNKNIASQLGICLQTVKLHRGRLMQKLQVDSIADLVRLAEQSRSIRPHTLDLG